MLSYSFLSILLTIYYFVSSAYITILIIGCRTLLGIFYSYY
nr:MAG TPA: hypothetical protein [Crassvirales sp.]